MNGQSLYWVRNPMHIEKLFFFSIAQKPHNIYFKGQIKYGNMILD